MNDKDLSMSQRLFIKRILKNVKINNSRIKDIVRVEDTEYHEENLNSITEVLSFSYSEIDRKNSGITFTPYELVEYMYESVLFKDQKIDDLLNKKIVDFSAGNGVFFVAIINILKNNNNFSVKKFISDNISAYEIKPENVYYLKLILSVLVEYYGEDSSNICFDVHVTDTIKSFIDGKILNKYDLIVGNPPYIKQQNISKEMRTLLLNNFNSINSNYNIYYAFIELSINRLQNNGRILLLVPNYLLKIKSANSLRSIILKNDFFEKIVDFESSNLFEGIDTYSMIMQLHRESKKLKYKKLNSLDDFDNNWETVNINKLNAETINLLTAEEELFVDKVIKQPNELKISTGIATLKDKIFLIDGEELNGYYIKEYDGHKYKIEKDLVVKIVKGSGKEKINNVNGYEHIIYPYTLFGNKAILISLKELKLKYPYAFIYLTKMKENLFSRSGEYSDNDFYKYGRSQALSRFDSKIIFPTNSDKPKFQYIKDRSLFYNGYAVYGVDNYLSSDKFMCALNIILNSSVVDRFMKLTSYYIGGGYVSYQKKYLEKVHIPNLNKDNIEHLVSIYEKGTSDEYDDKYIQNLYKI